jgi:xanthine dehydrogenase YagS FAD-binding subunit
MRPFGYQRAANVAEAIRAGTATGQGQVDAPTQFLAGGTTLLDLMKLEVMTPQAVVDIGPLARDYAAIESGPAGLRLGAFAKMSAVADDARVARDYPLVAQALQLAASAQIRNMATLGGNLLQRTRCAYFRDPAWTACNKRRPGSGCAAMEGVNRNFAVLGVDNSCIAQYPGDFAVALAALDAELVLAGPEGARTLPLEALHRPPGGTPHIETTLKPGEVITFIQAPALPWARRSLYLKIRDRSSYEFAVSSAAIALELDGGLVRQARIGLGGMAYRPWRAREVEAALAGKPLTPETAEAAARIALAGAVTHGHNDFKPELARRTIARALLQAGRMEA